MNTIAPDLAIAREFLDLLAPDGTFTFQTFDDDADRRNRRLARISHGTLDDVARDLIQLNDAGAGIFVTVSSTDLKGRAAKNVTGLRALYVDLDSPALAEPPIEPTIVVAREADRVRRHLYWLLADGQPLDRFTAAQKALIRFYGADKSVHDLPRVMRLPGFLHRKGEPQLVRIMRRGPETRYTIEEVLRAHGIGASEDKPPPPPCPDGTEQLGDFDGRARRCRAFLNRIPDAVSGDHGHNRCLQAACECFRFGLDDAQARETLDWFNSAKCKPPFSRAELDHKLADAMQKVLGEGDFGSRLEEERKPHGARQDFTAAGVVLVVEDARATETRWSATVRVVDAKTGEDLGSFPVTTSPTGLHAAERELMRLLKDARRVYGSDDDAALRRTLRSALDRKNLEELARREEAEELRSRPRQWGRDPIVDLVAGHLGATISPAFAGTKGKAWSETQGRTVEKSDLGVTTALLAKIADGDEFLGKLAAKKGLLALKQLAENALDVAWSDILRTLPDEIGAALGPQSKAAEAVRRQVVRAFHVTETWRKELRKDNDGKDREHIERASAATRTLGLKLGKVWIRVLPGCDVWARIDSKGRTRWGIRFSFVNGTQLKGSAKAPVCIERACDQAALTRLLKNYGMLDESGDPPDRLTGGGRIAVLSPELCDEILGHEQTACDPGTGEVREDGGAR